MLLVGGPASASEYSFDFRTGRFDNEHLKVVGTGAAKALRPTEKGLRVTVTGPDRAGQEVGCVLRFPLTGDFTITISYELVRIDRPDAGYGVGPTLYVATESKGGEAAMLGRLWRVKEGQVYSIDRASDETDLDGNPKRKHQVRTFPTEVRSGRLRLERAGSRLRYLVAEGEESQFRSIHEADFPQTDVVVVRIAVSRNGASTPAEVLFRDVAVTLPQGTISTSPATSPRTFTGGMWVWGTIGAVAVAAVLLTCWLWRRRR